jgi:hypothetical protein
MARTLVPVLIITSAAVLLTGCGIQAAASGPAPSPSASSSDAPEVIESAVEKSVESPSKPKPAPSKSSAASRPEATKTTSHQPKIVYFRIKQKPKCPEGTAVFRAPAVPLIIEWKITGAESGALSVDDPTHTPGTYGPTELTGTSEFTFSCGGPVGSVEKHTYALYTVGGGPQKSKTLSATAKVMDAGLGTE